MSVLFWDFDGTLVHSDHLWSGSMYKALKDTIPDTDVTFDAIRNCNKHGFTWQTPENDYTALTNEAWWEYMCNHFYNSYRSCGVNHEQAQESSSLVRRILKEPKNYNLYEDTLSTLEHTKLLGHTNVLLSNNYPELEEVLGPLQLLPLLDGIIVSAVEGYDKPRQELFSIAKQRFPSNEYYMIGDNISADIIGGNRAGMKTILVHQSDSPLADYSFCDLQSVLHIL